MKYKILLSGFFLSDNGAEAFGHNGGLNGQKGRLLEGGIRVPAIAYWKDKIQLDYNFSLMQHIQKGGQVPWQKPEK